MSVAATVARTPAAGQRRSDPASVLLVLALFVTAVVALREGREILLPIALATLISFLLTPFCNRLERWGLPRLAAVLLLATASLVIAGAVGWMAASHLRQLSRELPHYKDNIVDKARALVESSSGLRRVQAAIEEMQRELTLSDSLPRQGAEGQSGDEATAAAPRVDPGHLESAAGDGGRDFSSAAVEPAAVPVSVVSLPPSPLAQVRDWLGPLMAPVTSAGIVAVLVIFFLLQREDQRNRVLRLFGAANLHATTTALADVTDRVSRYLRMQFLINATYGLSVTLGMLVIGVPSSAVWGLLGFALRFLPYLGPWLAACMPIAVSLAVSDGWTRPVWVIGWFLLLELVVNNVAEPLLYGDSAGVSGVGVILSAIFWTWLWGPIGLVMATPLTVCLVVAAKYVPQLRFVSVMLGDEPTLRREERIYQRLLAGDLAEAEKLVREAGEDDEVQELADAYDRVLTPALRLAQDDRAAGRLDGDDYDLAVESLSLLAAEAQQQWESRKKSDDSAPQPSTSGSESLDPEPASRPLVLCVPLGGRADEVAGEMLGRLVGPTGVRFEMLSSDNLINEAVEAVGREAPAAVVVSLGLSRSLPEGRLFCRRLASLHPRTTVIVGLWGDESLQPLFGGGERVVASLGEASHRIRAAAASWQGRSGSSRLEVRRPESAASA